MPICGRAHECKEYEHWNEKKVWIVSGMKELYQRTKETPNGTLVKHELTQVNKMNNEALILREKNVLKCLWRHTKDPGSL